jgi:hypothetical protein
MDEEAELDVDRRGQHRAAARDGRKGRRQRTRRHREEGCFDLLIPPMDGEQAVRLPQFRVSSAAMKEEDVLHLISILTALPPDWCRSPCPLQGDPNLSISPINFSVSL